MSTMFSSAGGSAAGAGSAAPASGTPSTEIKSVAKAAEGTTPFFREKIKVDGQESELSFNTKEELLAELQKSRASAKRFEESSRLRKEAEAFHATATKAKQEADALREKYGDNQLMANIDAAIQSGDPERIKAARSIMEEKLAGLIRRDMMDPKERELESERELRKRAEGKIKAFETEKETAAREEQTNHWRKEFTSTIITALETQSVPNTDWTAAIMANVMRHNMQKGYKLTPEVLAEKTKQVMINQVTGLLDKAEGVQLIEWFPELIKKVRAADLARIRGRQPNTGRGKVLETVKPTKETDAKPRNGYMSPDQWREWTRKRAAAAERGETLPE